MNPMHRQRHSAQATTEYGIAIALIAVIAIAALASASVAVGGAFGFINQRVEAVIPTSGSGSTPTAFVTPAIQSVGQTVSVSGSGYTPDSSVTITLHSTPVVLGTTTADSAGNVGPVVETIPLGTDTTITHTITLSTATQTATSNDLTVTAPVMPLIFNQADVPTNLNQTIAYAQVIASPYIPLGTVQFNWAMICASGTACVATTTAINGVIVAGGSTSDLSSTVVVAPLSAGSHTILFSDLAALIGTSCATFPVAIVDNSGNMVGWAYFQLTSSVAGGINQISGKFTSSINPL